MHYRPINIDQDDMGRILTTSKVSPFRGKPMIELSSQQGFSVFFFILLLYFVSLFNFNSQKGSLKPFKSFATRSFARINVTSISPLPVESRLDTSDEAGSISLWVNNSFWRNTIGMRAKIRCYYGGINKWLFWSIVLTACCIHGRLFRLDFGSSSDIGKVKLLLRLVTTCCTLFTG